MIEYSKFAVSLENFFIQDFNTPFDKMPYVVQIATKAEHSIGNKSCLEVSCEFNPKEKNLNATTKIRARTFR